MSESPSKQGGLRTGAAAEWMRTHREELDGQYRRWRASEIRWSWARFGTFAAAVLTLILLRAEAAAALTATAGFLVLFGLSVHYHLRMAARARFGQRLLDIADESLQRCGGRIVPIRSQRRPLDPTDATCTVPQILETEPVWALTEQERDDLDLYAPPVGIFGLLNRTSSILGARRLRDMIEHLCLSIERIRARQACVAWLTENTAIRVRLMAAAAECRDQDERLDAYVRTVHSAAPLTTTWQLRLMRLWSIPSAAITFFAVARGSGGQYLWVWGLLALLSVNGALLLRVRGALRAAIEPWKDLKPTVEAMLLAARQAAEHLPERGDLARLRTILATVSRREVLPGLVSRIAWTQAGGMFHALCNLVFFYDVHVAHGVLNRIVPNRRALIDAAGAHADLEALTSLACFAWEQPQTCVPVPSAEALLRIDEGTHPLLEPAELVPNDLALGADERTWIITGSNMAGKSTFLRMVGVNVLLAQIGSAATARAMIFQPRRLITDLRIRDDLAKHESYFLAEVRQLRRMLEAQTDGVPLLGLIDEPFRGTNSDERVAAGVAVIGHLIDSPGFVLVATHEQELTELGKRPWSANYHFNEDLTHTGPVFDYHLRPGPATTRNALRILEREGYPPELLQRAQEHLRRSSGGIDHQS